MHSKNLEESSSPAQWRNWTKSMKSTLWGVCTGPAPGSESWEIRWMMSALFSKWLYWDRGRIFHITTRNKTPKAKTSVIRNKGQNPAFSNRMTSLNLESREPPWEELWKEAALQICRADYITLQSRAKPHHYGQGITTWGRASRKQ